MAFAVVVARLAITLVPLDFTVNAHEARGTLAVITPWPFLLTRRRENWSDTELILFDFICEIK